MLATDAEVRDSDLLADGLVDQILQDDPTLDLPQKINRAFSHIPKSVRYINWLGDDDIVAARTVEKMAEIMDSDPGVALVFGDLDYIDSEGLVLARNRLGRFSSVALGWLPQRIGQPATLYRREFFDRVGGLQAGLTHAFDMDLFLKLKKLGTFRYFSQHAASWRWHPGSLTVKNRGKSVREGSEARIRAATPGLHAFCVNLTERAVRPMTLAVGMVFDRKLASKFRRSSQER